MIGILHVLMNLLYFVTDFDGTIAHYEDRTQPLSSIQSTNPSNPSHPSSFDESALLELPRSTTGKIGIVSYHSINLLRQIRETNITIICASGMRAATMRQRAPFFPDISYWICENGGKIYQRVQRAPLDDVEPGFSYVELSDWTEHLSEDVEAVSALEELAHELSLIDQTETEINKGDYSVDREGYFSMLRVKGSIEKINELTKRVEGIDSLRYTFNLGYLDVFPRRSGKLAAVRWLIDRIETSKARDRSASMGEDLTVSDLTIGANEVRDNGADGKIVYMGDDNNDVEIAGSAAIALIAQPCSNAMQRFVDEQTRREKENNFEKGATYTEPRVIVAPFNGTAGTEALLHIALEVFRSLALPIDTSE